MAHIKPSDLNGIYFINGNNGSEERWVINDMKKLKKFNKWVKRHRLKPGDIIPKRIFKKYFERSE